MRERWFDSNMELHLSPSRITVLRLFRKQDTLVRLQPRAPETNEPTKYIHLGRFFCVHLSWEGNLWCLDCPPIFYTASTTLFFNREI